MDRAEPWRSNAYRDALDLVRAMQTQLPGELAVMEPSELEKEVKRCHGTIGLGSEALPPSRGQERTTAEDRKGRHHQNGRLLKTSHDENGEELTEVLVGLESIRPVKSGTSNLVYYR